MTDEVDRITFNCVECGAPLTIDNENPPNDEDIYKCPGCGRDIGAFGEVKEALVAAAKAEIDRIVEQGFGKKPTWRKG